MPHAKLDRSEIFAKMPVRSAVLRQVLPAIASQMTALIYNLADTYFVGRLDDPNQTAAVTVATAAFLMLTAISNLFGVGGASVISRLLGKERTQEAKKASAFSFWYALISAAVFSVIVTVLRDPILRLCGAKDEYIEFARGYAFYTLIIGAIPTVLTNVLANLVRSEGSAAAASIGVTIGCIINIVLDPIFILPWGFNMGAAGAGAATAISNFCGLAYFIVYMVKNRRTSVINLSIKGLAATEHAKDVLGIGFPSAIQYALTVVAVSAQMNFVSQYGGEAVAAVGITKKLDQLPLFFSIGIANGLLPLIGYNYAAGNLERTERAFRFGSMISLGFAVLCVMVYEIFAPDLARLFIENAKTVDYAASFLRRMVLAMPCMSVCYPLIVKFQAMGKAKASLIVSVLRKGVIDIPLYFLMDSLVPLYGCMWVQPIVDTVSLIAAVSINHAIIRELKKTESISLPSAE